MFFRMDEAAARRVRARLGELTEAKVRREVRSMAVIAAVSVSLMMAVEAAVIFSSPL